MADLHQMPDLHQMSNPDRNAGIGAVGWLFLAFASAVIALAVVIAYQGNDMKLANASVPHVVAR
jgi:hypothetical protein